MSIRPDPDRLPQELDRITDIKIGVPPSFTCPDCHMTSYNPNDIKHNYCGNCHEFKDKRL